jgi:glucose 1-dehydrogenase
VSHGECYFWLRSASVITHDNYAGKVPLVTGSSQGIGQAIAIRLAAEGANVAINYRSNPEGAQETVNKVEASGGKCYTALCPQAQGYAVRGDIGMVDEAIVAIADTIAHFGKLDILVNNAGIEKHAPFWSVTEADYDAVMNVNLKGAFFATQEIVKHLMATKRGGKIINISSVHEELPFPNFAAYWALSRDMCKIVQHLPITHAVTAFQVL